MSSQIRQRCPSTSRTVASGARTADILASGRRFWIGLAEDCVGLSIAQVVIEPIGYIEIIREQERHGDRTRLMHRSRPADRGRAALASQSGWWSRVGRRAMQDLREAGPDIRRLLLHIHRKLGVISTTRSELDAGQVGKESRRVPQALRTSRPSRSARPADGASAGA